MKTITIKCLNCGCNSEKPLKEIKRRLKTGKKVQFCSRECYQTHKANNYSMSWSACHARARYWYKLNHPMECAKCGRYNKHNQIHHKNGDYTDNSPNNLQCLCFTCHPLADARMRVKRSQYAQLEAHHD